MKQSNLPSELSKTVQTQLKFNSILHEKLIQANVETQIETKRRRNKVSKKEEQIISLAQAQLVHSLLNYGVMSTLDSSGGS